VNQPIQADPVVQLIPVDHLILAVPAVQEILLVLVVRVNLDFRLVQIDRDHLADLESLLVLSLQQDLEHRHFL